MRKIISLLGKPCAGKGTRLRKFLEGKEDQYMIVSCVYVLSEEVELETILGQEAKHYMDEVKLIHDYIIINLVLDQIRKAPEDISLILDGFPRTVEQAEAALECKMGITHVVNLVASDAEAISRSDRDTAPAIERMKASGVEYLEIDSVF